MFYVGCYPPTRSSNHIVTWLSPLTSSKCTRLHSSLTRLGPPPLTIALGRSLLTRAVTTLETCSGHALRFSGREKVVRRKKQSKDPSRRPSTVVAWRVKGRLQRSEGRASSWGAGRGVGRGRRGEGFNRNSTFTWMRRGKAGHKDYAYTLEGQAKSTMLQGEEGRGECGVVHHYHDAQFYLQ